MTLSARELRRFHRRHVADEFIIENLHLLPFNEIEETLFKWSIRSYRHFINGEGLVMSDILDEARKGGGLSVKDQETALSIVKRVHEKRKKHA